MNTHAKDRAETRQRLLDAGLKVFSEHGFSVTRLEDIAKEAGLTRGAFYWHFRYKLDLFRDIFSGALDELHAETRALLQSEKTPHEKLRAVILHIPTKLIEDAGFYAFGKLRYKIEWTDGLEESIFKPFLDTQIRKQKAALAEVLEEGKASGAFRRELATPAVVSMVEIFILGLTHQVLDGRDSRLQVKEIQDIVDDFLASISAKS